MNNFHQGGVNPNQRTGATGIGMGVGRAMRGGANYGGMPRQGPAYNQYAADPDDDFEDDDFGDVDEHQENDANHYKNTEARDDFNPVENKMLQARNFNQPSQRQHNAHRGSNAQAQSFAAAHHNPGQNPHDSYFNQLSQGANNNVLNIQTGSNRIEAYGGSQDNDGSRDSNVLGADYR